MDGHPPLRVAAMRNGSLILQVEDVVGMFKDGLGIEKDDKVIRYIRIL